jgi:hypothetical protein
MLALSLLVSGCGERLIKVRGKVVKNGQPFSVSEKGVLQIAFHKDEGGKTASFGAVPQKDGSFEILGEGSKGIPAGKYRITIEAIDPYPNGKDLLKGQFSAKNSKLVRDVTGSEEITLEVGSGSKS